MPEELSPEWSISKDDTRGQKYQKMAGQLGYAALKTAVSPFALAGAGLNALDAIPAIADKEIGNFVDSLGRPSTKQPKYSINMTGGDSNPIDAPVSDNFLNNGLEDFGAPILSPEQLDAPQRDAGGSGLGDLSLEDAMKMARRPQGKMETMLNNSIERLMGQKQTPEQADFDEGIRRMKTAAAMMGYGGTLAGPHIAAGMSTYADSLAAEKATQQGLEYKNLGLLGDAAQLEGQRADKEYAGGIDIYVAQLNSRAKLAAAKAKQHLEASGYLVPDKVMDIAWKTAVAKKPMFNGSPESLRALSMLPAKERAAQEELFDIELEDQIERNALSASNNRILTTRKVPSEVEQ